MTKQEIDEKFGKSVYALWWDAVIAFITNGKTEVEAFAAASLMITHLMGESVNF